MLNQGGFFMQTLLNFILNPHGIIAKEFLKLGIVDFKSAVEYVQLLPYKRNKVKENHLCIFDDLGGTCSTKHALLKNLADENNVDEVKLILGIFNMNKENTPKIYPILKKYNLTHIPEAHNYLKYKNVIFDYTRKNFSAENFIKDWVEEIEIEASQITDFKIKYHQNFLRNYLAQQSSIPYSLRDFWQIREECIATLQQ